MIYFYLLLWGLGGWGLILSILNKKDNYFFWPFLILCIWSVVFYCLRTIYSGTDTLTYVNMVKGVYDINNIEPLYAFFLKCLRFISNYDSIVIFILSFIPLILSILSYKRLFDLKYAFLCMFISMSMFSFFELYSNAIRQGLALSLFLSSIVFFRHSLARLLFIQFSSCLIHYSLIPLFIVFFVLKIMSKKVKLFSFNVFYFIFLTVFVFSLMKVDVFYYLKNTLLLLSSAVPSVYDKVKLSFDFYGANSEGSFAWFSINMKVLILTGIMLPLTIAFYIANFRKKFFYWDYCIELGVFQLIYAMLFFIMMNQAYSYRYLYVFLFFTPIFICFLLHNIKIKKQQVYVFSLTFSIFYSVFLFYPRVSILYYGWLF